MNYTLIVLLAYAVVMFGATVLMTKKEGNVERFCVGNRDIGWGISALSIAATWIWAPALFTSTENAYTKGFAGLFWFLVPNVLCLILFIPFAKRIREEMPEGITLSGYMHEKYRSGSVKNIYLLQLGALSVLSTGVQLLAGSKILSMLTGIPFTAMTVIMAAIAFSYSQFSGIRASILTDAIQMVFMLAASIGFVAFGVKNGGGLETVSYTDIGVINFELISTLFPAWAVIPFLFMVISGLLSTIDSNLCAVSSLTTDIFRKNTMGKTKLSMILLLTAGIAVANIPGLTVTHLFLMYGTLRASTLLPTVLTLKGVRLAPQGIVAGVISAMLIGLPVFGYGNIKGIAICKTAGSLLTVILSGAVALAVTRKRGEDHG